MPFLLIAAGVLVAGFMLATFQQVPVVGCFASSVFYNEIRVFNIPTRDPLCISSQLYYVGMIGGVALAGLGAVLALISNSGSAHPPTIIVGADGGPVPGDTTNVVHQTTGRPVVHSPLPEEAGRTMPALRQMVKAEIARREGSQSQHS